MEYEVKIKNLRVYDIQEQDCENLLFLIKQIAIYEKMLDQVTATKESLYQSIFIDKRAHVLMIEYDGKAVGYMLYFFNFSTFTGSANLYLEDLFILQEYRFLGIGKQMFQILASIAMKNNCQRIDWVCLNWNEPSLRFYKKIGAHALDFWVVHRLEQEAIENVANGNVFNL